MEQTGVVFEQTGVVFEQTGVVFEQTGVWHTDKSFISYQTCFEPGCKLRGGLAGSDPPN